MQNNICADRRKINLDLMCYLFLIFLTGCLVGWVYEEIFYWITDFAVFPLRSGDGNRGGQRR